MKIAELFGSIQGEGMLSGMPSTFVRTSGCNLRCVWCDTPYTSWEPEGTEMLVDEIVEAVQGYPNHHVVITGGEPMIAPQIVAVTEALHNLGFHITVETAGTVYAPVACDLMSISPKLANSSPVSREDGRWVERHNRLRIQPAVLRRMMSVFEYQLKFVVAEPSDIEEIRPLVSELAAAPDRVLLMPEGTDAETLRQRSLWLADLCKREQFRYCPRLHIDLWGHRRGV